jgi:hypothetical protein
MSKIVAGKKKEKRKSQKPIQASNRKYTCSSLSRKKKRKT